MKPLWGESYGDSGNPVLEALKIRARKADHLRLNKDAGALAAIRAVVNELDAILGDAPEAATDEVLRLASAGWVRIAILLPPADQQIKLDAAERAIDLVRLCAGRSTMPQEFREKVGHNLAIVLNTAGNCRLKLGDLAGAERDQLEAADLARTGLALEPGDPPWQSCVAGVLSSLALLRSQQGRVEEVREIYAECLPLRRAVAAAEPTVESLHVLLLTLAAYRRANVMNGDSTAGLDAEIVEVADRLDATGDAVRDDLLWCVIAHRSMSRTARQTPGTSASAAVDHATASVALAVRVLDSGEISEKESLLLLRSWVELLACLNAAQDWKTKALVAREAETRARAVVERWPGREASLALADFLASRVEAEVEVGQPAAACVAAEEVWRLTEALDPPSEPGAEMTFALPRLMSMSLGAVAAYERWRPLLARSFQRRARTELVAFRAGAIREGNKKRVATADEMLIRIEKEWRDRRADLSPLRFLSKRLQVSSRREGSRGELIRQAQQRQYARKHKGEFDF